MSTVKIIQRAKRNDEIIPTNEYKKVAAYCRVSTDDELQETSYDLQIESYTRIINEHPDWKLAGVYADKGISGTRADKRPEFNRMIEDAKNGKIDMIMAKSISRFARNTYDTLKYCRELKEIGVGIYFEKEKIDTNGMASELLLTIFAAFAQEESHSISENTKNGIRQKFAMGEARFSRLFGYSKGWKIVEDEASAVRMMYADYLDGLSTRQIAEKLNAKGIKTTEGCSWSGPQVNKLLKNEQYMGDVIMQKYYCSDYMKHDKAYNDNGVLDKYYKEDNHEGIVDKQTWTRVNESIKRAARKRGCDQNPYYGILRCSVCGRPMVKVGISSTKKAKAWVCQGEGKKKTIGERSKCPTYLLWADVLDRSVKSALEIDGSITYGKIDELVKKITIGKDTKSLIITHRDGKRKKYPLIFESHLDALEAVNVGFPYESQEALEATYECLKRSARRNIVIEKEECEIPEVIDPVKTIQKEKKNAGNKTRKRRKKA